jgi:hypothetical protein
VTTAKMIEQMMEGYEQALADKDPDLRSRRPECVRVVMRQAVERTWNHLAKERLEDTSPTIPLGKRFWPISEDERREIERIFATEDVRLLVTALRSRENDARVEVLDAAYWMSHRALASACSPRPSSTERSSRASSCRRTSRSRSTESAARRR